MKIVKKVATYITIVALALLCALNYEIFVFPNRFAPAGLNGICTMIQHVAHINMGYLSLVINLPLAVLVYFYVSKPLAVRSIVYTFVFSGALLFFEDVNLDPFIYYTDNSAILGPLVAGIIYGSCYTVLFSINTYTGGTDFVAAMIHKRHPNQSIFFLIFTINAMVAVASYFVYDYQIEPVLLCIIYSFTSSTISERSTRSSRSAIRFDIITEYPEEISQAIIKTLRHSATLVPGKGMYSGKETSILICIVIKSQMATLTEILSEYDHTFASVSQVGEVMGNFKHLTNDNKYVKRFLDAGGQLAGL